MLSSIKKFISLFLSALRGTDEEFTSGSIDRAIFLLAIPMIAEMILEAVFAVVDMYFVSKISVNAVATVGLTESMMMLIYSVAIGMAMATTAIVARRIGAKENKRAADAGFQAIFLATIAGVSIGIAGFLFSEELLYAMGGDDTMVHEGVGFTRIMFAGNISIMLIFLINAIFRGAGDASIAMWSLSIANGLNIILDPLLIFGWGPIPAFGIDGAAMATVTGRSIGIIFQIYFLIRGTDRIRITAENIVIRMKTIWEIIRISTTGIWQFLVETASWIFLIRIIAGFGMDAVAGYQIAFRVIVFTILPAWGLSNAAATLVGQNLGAKSPERAERSVWRTAQFTMIFLGLISVVFYFGAELVIGLFEAANVPSVLEIGTKGLKIICFGYLFFAYGMVITQAFNGAGDTKTPFFINFFVFWIFQIPLAYYLSKELGLNEIGVFVMIAVAHSVHAIVSVIIFRRGKWKLISVT
ncbi:MAG: MATE family efflux transporter [Bacteroidota bacterium]